jgi:HKD family nuclease
MCSHITSEILQADLLHPLDAPELFYQRLRHSVVKATTFYGAVAFWTIKPTFVGSDFPLLLGSDKSFLCIDIHQPTSIDLLSDLATQVERSRESRTKGPSIYIYLRDLEGSTEVWSGNSAMPEQLLHTKSLIFDFADGTSEIWVGSHNWTRRAIVGVNIEATLVLRVTQDSVLYRSSREVLEKIQSLCSPFNPRLARYYKWLQGKLQPKAFMELEGEQAGTLTQQEIKLFGTDPSEYGPLASMDSRVCLAVRDTQSGDEYLYNAAVTTATNSPRDITQLQQALHNNQQRFVYRQGRRFPRLELKLDSNEQNPVQQVAYCGTIKVHERLPHTTKVFSVDRNELWVETNDDPLLAQLRVFEQSALVDVGKEYLEGVLDILSHVKIRVGAEDPGMLRQERIIRDPVNHLEEDAPLFTRRIVELPAKQDK